MGRLIQLGGVLVFFAGIWYVVGATPQPPLACLCLGPMPVALLMLYFGGKMAAHETAERRHKEQIDAIKGKQ